MQLVLGVHAISNFFAQRITLLGKPLHRRIKCCCHRPDFIAAQYGNGLIQTIICQTRRACQKQF